MGMVEDLRFTRVRRHLARPVVADAYAATTYEIARSGLLDGVAAGGRLAIAVGSRRVARYGEIVRAVVDASRARRLQPIVIAAMGSHGAATAPGQREVLAANGIDEQGVGAPIDATMEVVELGRDELGCPVWSARSGALCEAIVAVNRVKRHTGFSGDFGSGIAKMLAVGLGKREGAAAIHGAGLRFGLGRAVAASCRAVLARLPVQGGVAIVENAVGDVARITAVPASSLFAVEAELVALATELSPSLGVGRIDVLILDRIGKDISGTAMDPWVVGRLMVPGEDDPAAPRIARIYARSLSQRSLGNAHGVGLADFVHERLASAIDWTATRTNALTAGAPQKSRLPLVMASDREAIDGALRSAGVMVASEARVVRVLDTAHLTELEVTEAVRVELAEAGPLDVIAAARPLAISASGDIVDP